MVFSVLTYRCESRPIKKAEHRRIVAFKLCWRRLLKIPCTAKEIKPVNPKGNQPWIFIGRTDAESPILRPPDAGNDCMRRSGGQQRMRWLGAITDSVDINLSKLLEIVKDREAWHATVQELTKCQTRLSNWTTVVWTIQNSSCLPHVCFLWLASHLIQVTAVQ